MIKIRFVARHSVTDGKMHDSVSHRLNATLATSAMCILLGNDYAQRMCIIIFFQYSAKCLKRYIVT